MASAEDVYAQNGAVSQARGVYVYDSWLACIMSLDCQDHFISSDVTSSYSQARCVPLQELFFLSVNFIYILC
jgi:ABC-type hemin transport system substrate-binding protein